MGAGIRRPRRPHLPPRRTDARAHSAWPVTTHYNITPVVKMVQYRFEMCLRPRTKSPFWVQITSKIQNIVLKPHFIYDRDPGCCGRYRPVRCRHVRLQLSWGRHVRCVRPTAFPVSPRHVLLDGAVSRPRCVFPYEYCKLLLHAWCELMQLLGMAFGRNTTPGMQLNALTFHTLPVASSSMRYML